MRIQSPSISATLGAAMLAAASLAMPLGAQTVPPTQHTQDQLELVIAGDKIIGMTLIGADGNVIGKVTDVVVAVDGNMQAAIVETESFLGMGGRRIAVPNNQLQLENGKLTTDLTREKAADMPEHPELRGK